MLCRTADSQPRAHSRTAENQPRGHSRLIRVAFVFRSSFAEMLRESEDNYLESHSSPNQEWGR